MVERDVTKNEDMKVDLSLSDTPKSRVHALPENFVVPGLYTLISLSVAALILSLTYVYIDLYDHYKLASGAEISNTQIGQVGSSVALDSEMFMEDELINTVDYYKDLELEAKAAYIIDVSSGDVLFEKNKNIRFPMASLTKVMTVLAALDLLHNDDTVVIQESDLRSEGATGLLYGEEWSIRDLAAFTLMTSSNDGATALARVARSQVLEAQSAENSRVDPFIRYMNEKALEYGYANMFYYNPTGLDEGDDKSGAYGTAREVGGLVQHLIELDSELFNVTAHAALEIDSLSGIRHEVLNTNDYTYSYYGLLASKTGYTDLAGGNLAIAIDSSINRPVVLVVLGSTYEGRFTDMQKLVEATMKTVSDRP